MAQLDDLKMILSAESDLSRFKDNEDLLNYALSYAESKILERRGTDILEPRYLRNQVEGARWWLSRFGVEGVKSVSENGEQTVYQEVPDWLLGVIPRLGTVRNA